MIEITPDRWLSSVMARAVHRVSGAIVHGEEPAARAALEVLVASPGFAYAHVPTADVRLAQLYEDTGFRVVDTGITLETDTGCGDLLPETTARPARANDAAAVEAIARKAFRFSRFHLDPLIPTRLADEIKAQWASNYFRGTRGDHMVVAERSGEVAGFLQLLSADAAMTIDLVAVAEAHRGRGLASDLIRFAARHCAAPRRLRVGTQAANAASLRLYETLGFRVSAASYVLHHHGTEA